MQPAAGNNHPTVTPARGRRIIKRLLLAGVALTLIAAILLVLTLVYYDRHPQAVKTLLQKTVASAIHGSCTIADLSYSLHRGYVHASGIHLNSHAEGGAFGLQIANLTARFALNGPFGARRLVIQSVAAENFAIQLRPPFNLQNLPAGRTTALQRLLTRLRRFWLFKEVVLSSVRATSGSLRMGTPDWKLSVDNINARLDTKWRLRLAGRATFQTTAGTMRAVLPQFSITTDSLLNTGSRPFIGRLQLSAATLHSDAGALETVAAAMQLAYRPRSKQLTWKIRQLDCRRVAIFVTRALFFKNLSLQAHGTWDVTAAKLQVSRWNLKAGALATLAGNAAATLKPPGMLYVGLENSSLYIAKLARRLDRQAAGSPVQLQISRPLTLSGWLRLSGSGQSRQTGVHLTGRLHAADVHYTDVGRQKDFRGRLSSTIQVDGALHNPRISLQADLRQAVLHDRARHAVHFNTALRIAGHYPRFDLSKLTVAGTLPDIQINHRTLVRPIFKLSLTRGRIDVQRRKIGLPDVAVALGPLKNFHLAVFGRPEHFRITLNGARNRLLRTAAALNLLPSTWQFKAADRFTARAVFTHGTWQTASARLEFHDFSFASPDGQSGAEKIAAEITAVVSRDTDGDAARLHIQAAANGGEILWGRFYANLVHRRPLLSADLTYDPDCRKVTLANAHLSLRDLLQVQLRGWIDFHARTPELALDLKVPPTAAVPLFKWLAVDPFEFDLPVLSTLKISGRLGLDLNLARRQRRWQVKGRILWQNGRLTQKNARVDLQDIDLDLPFWAAGPGSTGRTAALSGRLRVGRLRMPFLPSQPLSLRLLAAPNQITASGLTLRTAGGKLCMGRLIADHIFSPQAVIKTSLTIPALNLKPFTSQLPIPIASATASGKLDPLVLNFAHDRLSGHGTIHVAAYDGTVKLQNPALASLFSPPPTLMLNVAFAGINLEKLTAGTSFGRIEGILNGHVRHLEIVDGQPQRFDLLIETVKRKGIAQKISVTAVKNISRIGGVPSPFVGLAGVFAGLLKSFGYRKIGVRATLRNDVFHINGTIHENGREYLVKKGGLSGVDVVNWNPDNRISFTDMLERLKRIRSSPGRPVVK